MTNNLVINLTMLGSIVSILMFLGFLNSQLIKLIKELKNIKHNIVVIHNMIKDIESFLAKKGDYHRRSQSDLFED